MGKFYCVKDKQYLFANNLCPEKKESDCKLSCVMHTYREKGAYRILRNFYKHFKPQAEVDLYELFWETGIMFWFTLKQWPKRSWELSRRLWSLPENFGHKVHQEFIYECNRNALQRFITKLYQFLKIDRRNDLFEKVLSKYEALAKQRYKHYKPGVWHHRNKKLWAELKKEGYKTGKLKG